MPFLTSHPAHARFLLRCSQASPAGILTIIGLKLMPSEVTSKQGSREELEKSSLTMTELLCLSVS